MNEPTVKLYQQALEFAYMSVGKEHADTAYFQGAVAGKFAELIVAECAKLNKHQYYELMGVITDVEEGNEFDDVCLNTVKRVADHLAKDLKEHFGVE